MRIAVWHNLPSGGAKRALYDHIRGLTARGHTVEAWCPPTADRIYLPLADLVREHVVSLEWPAPRRWHDVRNFRLETERSVAAMDDHCRRCAAEINPGGFDILLSANCMFFRATAIARFVELPAVLYHNEPYRWLYEAMPRLVWLAPPPSTRSPLNPLRWRAALGDWRRTQNLRIQAREEFNNAAAFDRILVNSLFSRESVLRAYGLDSDVCYLGADTDMFTDQGLPRENFVVGLGAFTPEKNLRLVIEAIALLPAPRPELAWIGNVSDSRYLDEMTALAASRGVKLSPHERIGDAELIDILNRATAMVYAPRLEPFGLAPIEAGACGLPVVGVAEGGVRESVVDNVTGLLVGNDAGELAKAIGRVFAEPDLARRLGAAGRASAEGRWSLPAATDRIERLLARYAKPRIA